MISGDAINWLRKKHTSPIVDIESVGISLHVDHQQSLFDLVFHEFPKITVLISNIFERS